MLEEFIRSNYHGLVAIRTFSNRKEFDLPLVITYFKMDYEMNPKGTKYWHNRILKIASKYRNHFYFAMSSTKEFEVELREIGVNNFENDMPIVIVILETDEKFVLKDNFSWKYSMFFCTIYFIKC
ncbi:hypothetical protein WA026_008537 [Henosepilachna vigintioctopunctata]|uniref:Uncharacterized protein n=1 Tax=Henosepilachna vigintioctopunctata TaxID=420089 RepID=A0AAW1UJV9_9CUCU